MKLSLIQFYKKENKVLKIVDFYEDSVTSMKILNFPVLFCIYFSHKNINWSSFFHILTGCTY